VNLVATTSKHYVKILGSEISSCRGPGAVRVLFLDCDVLVTRTLDGWFQSEHSILYATGNAPRPCLLAKDAGGN